MLLPSGCAITVEGRSAEITTQCPERGVLVAFGRVSLAGRKLRGQAVEDVLALFLREPVPHVLGWSLRVVRIYDPGFGALRHRDRIASESHFVRAGSRANAGRPYRSRGWVVTATRIGLNVRGQPVAARRIVRERWLEGLRRRR